MRAQVIEADTIDAAVERILDELKEGTSTARSSRNRENVIYFDGWDGLGASAVLRAVAERLAAMASDAAAFAGLKFEQIIHVDCSKWESRRALQRAIAEQLELPTHAMDMFRRQDEEDDFNGVAKGSRNEIPQVVEAMYQHIEEVRHRFLVILLNGSSQEVDLDSIGLPLYGYSRNKVLWTFQGRLRLCPRVKVDRAMMKSSTGGMTTDVFLSASCSDEQDPLEHWAYLVRQEAADVVRRSSGILDQPVLQVSECFLYMLKLCCLGHHFMMDYDLATQCCHYWMCDGIIQQQRLPGAEAYVLGANGNGDDGLWQAANALQSEIHLDMDYCHHHPQYLPSYLLRCAESLASLPYWGSPAYGFLLLNPVGGAIPNGGMFQHLDKLGVLKLSHCTFNFTSPPFLCCRGLKFLWLDHCQDQAEINTNTGGTEENEQGIQRCFQRLWVLDMRYTRCDRILSTRMLGFMTQLRELHLMGVQDWDMGQMQGQLSNIHKLRVTNSTVRCTSCSEEDLFSGMDKMELLDLSGNHTIQGGVTGISTSNNQLLRSVKVAEGCVGIQRFSFRGCAILKNLLLSGFFADLRVLDLSGTAIKMLDLSAMTAQKLDELYLDDCEELCVILWPPKDKTKKHLQKLHIDTTPSAGSTSTAGIMKTSTAASLTVAHGARPPSELDWCIAVNDSRLLRSLVPSCKSYFECHAVHVEIFTTSHHRAIDIGSSKNDGVRKGTRRQQRLVMSNSQQEQLEGNALVYGDVAVRISEAHLIQVEAGEGDTPTITRTWPCPPAPHLRSNNCYLKIRICNLLYLNRYTPLHYFCKHA
ncbi:hypothetical protein BS78_06G002700 [Paspalum vaginatum]|nr:hypothetical protein BS78_06G002700 [Paspalum vaginatum]